MTYSTAKSNHLKKGNQKNCPPVESTIFQRSAIIEPKFLEEDEYQEANNSCFHRYLDIETNNAEYTSQSISKEIEDISNSRVIQRMEYTPTKVNYSKEIQEYNKNKQKDFQVFDSEKDAYIGLREAGFEMNQITKTKEGADFVADDGQRKWLVEAKGTGINWLGKDNLSLAKGTGGGVPAKQLAHSMAKVKNNLLKATLGERVLNQNLVLTVTNLGLPDAMMAIIINELDENKNISYQHPITVSEILRFIEEKGFADYESIYKLFYEDLNEEEISQKVYEDGGQLYGINFEALESEIDDALSAEIRDWSLIHKDEKIDNKLNYLENIYNLVRQKYDHSSLGSDSESLKSLDYINKDKKGNHYIYLQPVHSKVPTKISKN